MASCCSCRRILGSTLEKKHFLGLQRPPLATRLRSLLPDDAPPPPPHRHQAHLPLLASIPTFSLILRKVMTSPGQGAALQPWQDRRRSGAENLWLEKNRKHS